ncbi:MAG: glycosyl transferase [Planctomycetota bacterium]|nr:glycosyl transferase [Planctomycetota bacterium]
MTVGAVATLDVIIAATDSAEAASRCAESAGCRVIIAYDPARIDRTRLPKGMITVAGERGADAHRLRSLGLARSTAGIVAFTEDSCVLSAGWAEAWFDAFVDGGVFAATGPVEHRRAAGLVNWGVFLCEYAPFLTASAGPLRGHDKPQDRLAGNNFAVRRSLLDHDALSVHETCVAARLRALGGNIVTAPGAMAFHVRRFRLQEAVLDRLRFGHQFGQQCAARAVLPVRLARIVLGPMMLASQVVRLSWTLARKRRHGGRLLDAGPITVGLLTAWTVGEWLGWVRGADRSSARPRYERAGQSSSRRPVLAASARRDCTGVLPIV